MEAITVSVQCGNCGSSDSTVWCLDCNEGLCDVCLLAHRRVTVTRSHQIFNQPPGGDTSISPIKFCRLHPCEPIKLYCFTCNELTCRDCQLTAHMNHRYQFVSEALNSMREKLEVKSQSLRAQQDTVSRRLQNMKTRMQDIINSYIKLGSELQQSYNFITSFLKVKMEGILKEVQSMSILEYVSVQSKMTQLKNLHENQQSVTEMIEKNRNTNNLLDLWTCIGKVESQLKDLSIPDLSPPKKMSDFVIVAERVSLEALLNFGSLQVSSVPFSVSQTSSQNSPATSSSFPPNATDAFPIYRLLPQTSFSSSVSPHLSPSSITTTPTTSTTLAPSSGTVHGTGNTFVTESAAPVHRPSTSGKSFNNQLNHCPSSNINQSNAPVTRTSVVTTQETVPLPPYVLSVLRPVTNLVQPSIIPLQNQSTSMKLTNNTHQGSNFTFPSVTPQLPKLLRSTSVGNKRSNQKKRQIKNINQRQFNPASVSSPPVPLATTENQSVVGTKALSIPTTSSRTCSEQHLTPNISLKDRHNPVVRAIADSACDRIAHGVTMRQKEPVENEPTSTMSEESIGNPYAPRVSGREAEEPVTAPTVAEGSVSAPKITKQPVHVPELALEPVPPPEEAKESASVSKLPEEPVPVAEDPQTTPTVAEESVSAPKITEEPVAEDPQTTPTVAEDSVSAPKITEEPVAEAPITAPTVAEDSISVPKITEEPVPVAEDPITAPTVAEDSVSAPKITEDPVPVADVAVEPAPLPEVWNTVAEEQSHLTGHLDRSQSQQQPRVSLCTVPESLSHPGHPHPYIWQAPVEAEDENLKVSEGIQFHAGDVMDDISQLPSSPESPVTLVTVNCSACQSDSSSVICSLCSRGYHWDCHVPPVGPNIRSDWFCSLCQDLSDPEDPFSSDRPPRPQGPGLSLYDQRSCENLLLYLKVVGCARLPQCQLNLMAKRLSLHHSPSYQTATEFLSDVYCLFKDRIQNSDVLNQLRERCQMDRMKSLPAGSASSTVSDGGTAAVSRLTNQPGGAQDTLSLQGSDVKSKEQEVSIDKESHLKKARKRLQTYLELRRDLCKRTKKDKKEDKIPHV